MNRAERRAAERARRTGRPGPVQLCPPGGHAFGRVAATVAGEETAVRVVCAKCRRTFEQVMEESPEDLAIYRRFLEDELAEGRS